MTTISLCMMVKNEEAFLPQCLQSVSKWVDEIIIVDTGSTDRTVEIAKEYGAKVYHHPWEKDFSKHRNQSISYASGDWILIMDADERLENGHGQKIRSAVRDASREITKIGIRVVDVRVIDDNQIHTSMVTYSLRIFRNGLGGHYEGIVHNVLIEPDGPRFNSDVVLYHYGYGLAPEKMEQKFQRTNSLLEVQLREKPDDPYALYNMMTTLRLREPQKAVEYGARLIEVLGRAERVSVFYINLFYEMAAAFVALKDLKKAKEMCVEAIKRLPEYVDAYWLLCEISFDQEEYLETICHGESFLHFYSYYLSHREELSQLFVYSFAHEDKVRLRLGLSYLYDGNWAFAEPHLKRYVNMQPDKRNAINTILGHAKSRCANLDELQRWICEVAAASPLTGAAYKVMATKLDIIRAVERVIDRKEPYSLGSSGHHYISKLRLVKEILVSGIHR